MDTATRQGLEALLFLVDEPIDVPTLAELLGLDEDAVEEALLALAAAYEREERGLTIRRAAGGWRMYTAEAAYPAVERYVLAGKSGRLTQAALETLAVIAYKQPISRQEVGDIRGVNADGAVRSLVNRGYVQEVGRDEGPGQAVLYGTTTLFLERLGLDDPAQLPPLTEFLPEEHAPDEPGPADLRAARRHLAAGDEIPSTGRARWQPGGRATNTGPDATGDEEDDDTTLPPMEAPSSRREQDEEMDELTAALERAARSAMAQLRDAVAAAEEPEEAEPGQAQPGEDEGAGMTGQAGEEGEGGGASGAGDPQEATS